MILRFLRRIRTLIVGRRLDRDIARELDFHVDMETAHRTRAGLSSDEARRTALRDFGGVGRIREEVRDVRGITLWDSFAQDVRFGVRTLSRSPGYTLAAILILALGIGVNTAIFSVIDGVLLKPLPFRDGRELVLIQQFAPAQNVQSSQVSIPQLFDYRARLQSIRDLVEYHAMSFTLLNEGEPDRVDTGVVSANFFDMLGVRPLIGRTFVDQDDDLGADAVLVLSYEYWQQKFGGDRTVIGRVLQMNNRPHTIIGVLPAHPQYPQNQDVYMSTSACPFRSDAERRLPELGHRAFASLNVFGRLAPGATEAQATREVATVATSFPLDYSQDYTRFKSLTGRARSLQEQLVVGARPMLYALGGATLLVLLIACANVANLSLARTLRRQRELALRTALGASRGRLFRQLVTESVLVAIAGGVLGLGLAWLSLDLLVGFVGRFTARTGQIAMDAGVLWFALGTAVVTGLVFGSAPALSARKRGLAQSIRDGGAQPGAHPRRQRLRAALVVAQVAVSFMLVVGAALLLESFYRLSIVPLGYDTRQVVTAAVGGNFTRVPTAEAARALQSGVLERLRASPGVRSAAVTSSVPLSNIVPGQRTIRVEGWSGGETRTFQVDPNIASEGYFETLSVPILGGRSFAVNDTAGTLPVAVINESLAKFWGGASPVGARFLVEGPVRPGQEPLVLTIIGVVADFRLYSADRPVEPQYYQTFRQSNFGGGRVLVRTDGRPSELAPIIKAAVHATDSQVPVEQIQTLDELKYGRLAVPGLTATLLSIFAGVALVITLAGLAGVIGTSVSQRTREFGLRMALGASRGSVLQLVLRQGMLLVGVGLVLGLGGAYLFSRLFTQYLFATTPTDIGAYLAVVVLFLAAAVAASFGPARRATSIDPLVALRSE